MFRPEKDKWSAGTVVKLDLVGQMKRVKFHFPRLEIKHDEWIEIDSNRVASLYSKTPPPVKKDSPKSEPSFSLKEKKTKEGKTQISEKKRKIRSLESSSEEELEFSETDNFSVEDESSPQSHPEADVDDNVPAKNGSSESVKKKLKKLKKLNKSKNHLPEKTTESIPSTKSLPEHSVGRDSEPLQENLQKDENGFMRIPRKTSSPKKHPSTQDRGAMVKKVLTAVEPESGPSPGEVAASPSGTRIPRKAPSGPKKSEAAPLVAVVNAEQGKVPSKTGTDEPHFSVRRPTEPYNSSHRRSSEGKHECNQEKTSKDDAPGETTAARKLPLVHTQDCTLSPGHASALRGSESRSNCEPSRRSSSSQLNLATEASSTRLREDADKVHGHARDYRYSHGTDRVDPQSSHEPYRQGSYRDFAEKESSQDQYALGSGRETVDDNGKKSHQKAYHGYDSRREYADDAQEGYRRGSYREKDQDYDRSRRGSKDRYHRASYREYDEDYDRPRRGSHGGYTRGSHREYEEDYDRPRQGSKGGYNRGSNREYGEDYKRPRKGSQGDYSRRSYREHGHRDYDKKGSEDCSNSDLYREYGEAYDKPQRGSQDRHRSFRDMDYPRKKT